MKKERQNFEKCFKGLQEAGLFIEDKITRNSEIDKEVYCGILDTFNEQETGIKVIFYKTKIGVFGIILPLSDNDTVENNGDSVWYVDFPEGNALAPFLNFLSSKYMLDHISLELFIGNHLPEPGSIEPINNVIYQVDEWLINQKKSNQ